MLGVQGDGERPASACDKGDKAIFTDALQL